ncbi:hypothetical protein Sango_0031600 [Sesamum angolense]|uniref:Uncharacterized protein n=1 Tax=Sesamum angolense TaxID=2727404 RepID=A0AAE1XCU7_9LAMI|nr:hypothetical protein Sango_0031600 [Sesamum angolense]
MEQPLGYVAREDNQMGSKDDTKFNFGYFTYVDENFDNWCSKQTTIARSSVEAKYMAIAHTTSDILWLKNSLGDLGFENNDPVSIIVIKQKCELLVIRFPWRTKHVQVNCTFFLRQL